MKKSIILCMLLPAVLFTTAYAEVVTTFPDMAKPIELRMDNGYIFISDQSTVSVYDEKTFKLVAKLGRKGEGPKEFKTNVRMAFTNDKLVVYDSYKLAVYSKDFKYIKEMRLLVSNNRVNPVGDNYVIDDVRTRDGKKQREFNLFNGELKKTKTLLTIPRAPDEDKYLINPWSWCRSRDGKVFISQPRKGFYIDVFDENGNKLYHIDKKIKPVKSSEIHRQALWDELKYFVGRRLFEKAKAGKGIHRPMREFVPPIENFWVADGRIYVKTNDITETTEKYIIMDLEGNILQTVFLPIVYLEIFTFHNNRFYYLWESEDDEGWELHSVTL